MSYLPKPASSGVIKKHWCACGNEAFRRFNGEYGCERCIKIEKDWAFNDEIIRRERIRKRGDFYEPEMP